MTTISSNYQLTSSQSSSSVNPKADFMTFMDMSPGEKMRALVLGSLGYTEEDLKAMTREEREKIEEKIKEMIKKKVEEQVKKGSLI